MQVSGDQQPVGRHLTGSEFAAELQLAAPTLWVIAAGVLGHRRDVDDVVQDAAMVGLRKIETFQRGTSFVAWMGQIVRNVARNRARQNRRDRSTPLEGVEPTVDTADVSADFDRRVLDALGTLEETARTCLLLRTVREMSYQEIAVVLDLPEGTAMSHVSRSRKRMRDALRTHEDIARGG